MKHLTKLILIFMTFLIQIAVVDALSLDSNTITLSKGESSSVGIYANLDEEATSVSFSLIFTSYDVPATFKVEDGFKNVVSNSINFILFSYISLINLYFYSSNSGLSIDTALTSNYSYKPLNVTLKSITDVLAIILSG